MRRAAFLDRDGTIIVERHYLSRPEQVELIPGAGAALRALQRLDIDLVIVTNQSGISRGFFDLKRLGAIHARMRRLLAAEGVRLAGLFFCPHTPEDDCACRKPRTGLLDRAARELGYDLAASFAIGDKLCDIESGRRVGATTFLVRTGYGAEVAEQHGAFADYVVTDLRGAVPVIARLMKDAAVGRRRPRLQVA